MWHRKLKEMRWMTVSVQSEPNYADAAKPWKLHHQYSPTVSWCIGWILVVIRKHGAEYFHLCVPGSKPRFVLCFPCAIRRSIFIRSKKVWLFIWVSFPLIEDPESSKSQGLIKLVCIYANLCRMGQPCALRFTPRLILTTYEPRKSAAPEKASCFAVYRGC